MILRALRYIYFTPSPRNLTSSAYDLGDIDYESVAKLAEGFNGADLRNICTEAGLFAIRENRDYVLEEDFMRATRKIAEVKKLESKMDYSKI